MTEKSLLPDKKLPEIAFKEAGNLIDKLTKNHAEHQITTNLLAKARRSHIHTQFESVQLKKKAQEGYEALKNFRKANELPQMNKRSKKRLEIFEKLKRKKCLLLKQFRNTNAKTQKLCLKVLCDKKKKKQYNFSL